MMIKKGGDEGVALALVPTSHFKNKPTKRTEMEALNIIPLW